jgi:hypothetical protein
LSRSVNLLYTLVSHEGFSKRGYHTSSVEEVDTVIPRGFHAVLDD